MRNWIIVLLIFTIPMGLYAYLDAKAQNAMMCTSKSLGQTKTPIENKKVKIIKFSSPMCSECKEAGIELDKAMKERKDAFIVEEINVTKDAGAEGNYTKEAIKKYKVTLVPTIVFVNKEGKVIHKEEGAMKSSEIIEIIDGSK